MNEHTNQIAEREAANRKRIADLTDTYIKNLAVTTGIYDCITDPYDALKNGDQYSSVMPDLVRFAELIVKECAGIYDKIDNGNLHMGTDNYLEALAKHFGIK